MSTTFRVFSTRGHITKLSKSATARAETIRRLRDKRTAEPDKLRKRAMMEVIKMKVAELKLIRARIKELRAANKAALAARPASARPARANSARPSLAGRPRDARGRLLPTGRAKTPRARSTRPRLPRGYKADQTFDSKGRAVYAGPFTKRSARFSKRGTGKYLTMADLDQQFGLLDPAPTNYIAVASGKPVRRRAVAPRSMALL